MNEWKKKISSARKGKFEMKLIQLFKHLYLNSFFNVNKMFYLIILSVYFLSDSVTHAIVRELIIHMNMKYFV